MTISKQKGFDIFMCFAFLAVCTSFVSPFIKYEGGTIDFVIPPEPFPMLLCFVFTVLADLFYTEDTLVNRIELFTTIIIFSVGFFSYSINLQVLFKGIVIIFSLLVIGLKCSYLFVILFIGRKENA